MNHNAMINTVFKEVRACCKHLLQAYDRVGSPYIDKDDKERFAQTIDLDIQNQIVDRLKDIYPKHHFIAEEDADFNIDDLNKHTDVWVIDPIDGSNNFIHNIPFFSISLCYYYKGEAKAAIVFDPIHDELFTAISGKGAQLNQRRTSVSQCKKLNDSICGLELHSKDVMPFSEQLHRIRRIGCTSLALCYVACGRMDMVVCEKPNLWDMAAGKLIAIESGAKCYNHKLQEYKVGDQYLCLSNKTLYSQIK